MAKYIVEKSLYVMCRQCGTIFEYEPGDNCPKCKSSRFKVISKFGYLFRSCWYKFPIMTKSRHTQKIDYTSPHFDTNSAVDGYIMRDGTPIIAFYKDGTYDVLAMRGAAYVDEKKKPEEE